MLNEETQDEIGALEAIYPEFITVLSETRLLVKIPQHDHIHMQISFPSTYPSTTPPNLIELTSTDRSLDISYLKSLFQEVLESCYTGQACIFDFLTELDGILYVEPQENAHTEEPVDLGSDPMEGWTVSEPVVDRKSTFIAFALHTESEEDAFAKLDKLKTDNRIARSSHVMTAWRISGAGDVKFADCDDDGETAAGGRLLHLLHLMDVNNCMVAVVRWYGGVHLGPDRFKHINSTARDAIVNGGFI